MQYATLERLTDRVGKEYKVSVCLGVSRWSNSRDELSFFVHIPYSYTEPRPDFPYITAKSDFEMLSFLRWLLQGVKK